MEEALKPAESNHTALESESQPESENDSPDSDYKWIPEPYFDKEKRPTSTSSTNNVGELLLHSYIELTLLLTLTNVEHTN